MQRSVTEKDVLYALQYMGSRLVMRGGGNRLAWSLEPEGLKVTPAVADAARADSNITAATIRGEVSYVWRAAA
jgi:hypothetical protein